VTPYFGDFCENCIFTPRGGPGAPQFFPHGDLRKYPFDAKFRAPVSKTGVRGAEPIFDGFFVSRVFGNIRRSILTKRNKIEQFIQHRVIELFKIKLFAVGFFEFPFEGGARGRQTWPSSRNCAILAILATFALAYLVV